MPRSLARHARRRAFTLIEVLVATAISIVLVLGVVQIAGSALGAYDNAVALTGATATARTVLDTVETDLRSALVRNDGQVWIECVPAASLAPGSSNLRQGAAMDLYFFASPTDRDRIKPGKKRTDSDAEYRGDVCALAYRLRLQNPLPEGLRPADQNQDRVFALYRTVANAEDTYTGIIPVTQKSDAKGPYTDYWQKSSASGTFIDKRNATPNPKNYYPSDILASHVLAFVPTFIFKATDTSKTPAVPYFYYMTPKGNEETAADLNPAAGSVAYSRPGAPGSRADSANSFDAGLKIAAAWCAKNSAAQSNADLAAAPASGNKASGQLVGVILSLVVLDDVGAGKLRAIQNTTGQTKIDDTEFDKIYGQHTHFFTRHITLGN